MDPFLTTYRKDYTIKTMPTIVRPFVPQEFSNPLGIGFKDYLKLRKGASTLNEPDEEYEDDYLRKFKELYPKLGTKYFSAPINEAVVEEDRKKDGYTIYQVDYCDVEKDRQFVEELKKRHACTLPDDWVLPSTSYLKAYRNPTLLNPKALEVVQKIPPRNNLKCQEKLNKILKVRTGRSQYQASIGELGHVIIDNQMHGKIVHPKCT